MGSRNITITGLDELQAKLKRNVKMEDVKTVVKYNGAQLDQKMVKNAKFNKGYQTGITKRSIKMTMSDAGFTSTVEPTTEYSPYLEYGTRFMEAQPFVKPSLNEQKVKFKSDLAKLMK